MKIKTRKLYRFYSVFFFLMIFVLISSSRSSPSNWFHRLAPPLAIHRSPISAGSSSLSLSLSFLKFLKIYDFMVEDNWNFFMSSTVEFVTSCLCFDCNFLMVLLTIFFLCSYMVEKNRNLQNQFEAEASTTSHGGSGSVKPIFDGVSIFVDGFTVPSSQVQSLFIIIFCWTVLGCWEN